MPDIDAGVKWITKPLEPFTDLTKDTRVIFGTCASKGAISVYSLENYFDLWEEVWEEAWEEVSAAINRQMADEQEIPDSSASSKATQDKRPKGLLEEEPVSPNGEPTTTKGNGSEKTVQSDCDRGLQ